MDGEGRCRIGETVKKELDALTEALMATYADGIGVNASDANQMPRREEVYAITDKLLEVIFPGFDGDREHFASLGDYFTGALVGELYIDLSAQVRRSMRCRGRGAMHRNGAAPCGGNGENDERCCGGRECEQAVLALFRELPAIRETMKLDVEAAYAGDPAASSDIEIILSYPGIKAITIQRLAHVLYHHKVPLLPRLMTEYAHSLTGIDIHPGARLGRGIFIDHGTGVVIGETVILGDGARLYQGVTLGAFNFPKDACGMLVKGLKRHPTIGERVTIYAGATVLGDIEIGHDSVIGGNVWLTESLPPNSKISVAPPEQKIRVSQSK